VSRDFNSIELTRLDEYQYEIYKGLKHIGEEIATLYLDGVKIFECDLPSKPYLLAHIAREIEGGIRDIFVSPQKIKYETCEVCGSKIKKFTHIDEICEVLGVDKENKFAREWHKIAKQFHKYAHRHGAYKSPRDKEEFDKLWKKFEKYILYRIVGQYLDLIRLIDKILNVEIPTQEMIDSTKNMLKDQSIENYFFSKVSNNMWFYPLKEQGYFSPEKLPTPEPTEDGYFHVPYWYPLDYLKKISLQIKEGQIKEIEKYTIELIAIIKNITNYRNKNNVPHDNYHVWVGFIEILSNLPAEFIAIDIIDLIPVWLDSKFGNLLQVEKIINYLLPKFLGGSQKNLIKAEKIIDYITEIKKGDKKEDIFVVEPSNLKELFDKYSGKIGEKCSTKVIKDLKEKMKSVLKTSTDGTYISFYEKSQFLSEPVELLAYGLRKIMLAKAKNTPRELEPILSEFLTDNSFIFPKIAIYTIAENIDKFREFFFKTIQTGIGIKIFRDTLFWGDELRHLLENLKSLGKEERKILEEKINKACKEIGNKRKETTKTPEEIQETIILHKQKIYKALSRDKHFMNLYREIKNKSETDVELGPAIAVLDVKIGWGKSPIPSKNLIKMSNKEIAYYLSQFKTENYWEGPTIEALAETLRNAVKTEPEKFTEDLTPFMNTGYLYVYELLDGFSEALRENKSVDLEKVFVFILSYIDRKEFWENKLIVHPGISHWEITHKEVIKPIASLIMEGIQISNSNIPTELVDKMEKVISLILEKLDYKSPGEIDDYLFYTLNTAFGQILESYIKLILQKGNNVFTHERCKKFIARYEEFLDEGSIEAWTWFGVYIIKFYRNLRKWTEERIKGLKDLKYTPPWEAFMNGYLLANNVVYKEIYELLKEHYKLSIDYKFKKEEVKRRLISHISLAYLYSSEPIEKQDIFYDIIRKFNVNYLKEIISFFSRTGDTKERIDAFREKILLFWKYLYNRFKRKRERHLLKEKDEIILSELLKLTLFLPEITEEYKNWLLLSVPYVKDMFNFYSFIKYLDNLKDKGDINKISENVAIVFLETIKVSNKKNFLGLYPQENIKSLVEYLYRIPETKEYARRICNIYAKSGGLFLRELYEKYENS